MLCSAAMGALESELKELIVSALELADVDAVSINSAAPLFGSGEGLGLDSIDALELAVALSKTYGVNLKADDEETRQVFSSVSTLAAYIEQHRATENASARAAAVDRSPQDPS